MAVGEYTTVLAVHVAFLVAANALQGRAARRARGREYPALLGVRNLGRGREPQRIDFPEGLKLRAKVPDPKLTLEAIQ